MQKEKWFIKTKRADFEAIGRRYNVSPILARIIRNRDIIEDSDIDMYLNGNIDSMHSPWMFKDMDTAVEIINIKVNQHNKIRIICDYDIDGICSGFILLECLEKLGSDVDVVVPHRIEDGYGINEHLIKQAYDDGVDTIITCDNGIAAKSAIEYGKSLGMTIIITDHHEVPFEEKDGQKEYIIPNADAVINHKQFDCNYPFKELCGAAVAYKFIQALYETRGEDTYKLRYYLQFVAIATIGDVVDLVGENRVITKYGLDILRNTDNIGISALIDACGVEKESISSYSIGFVIGPCLNASGRLDTAKKAKDLLKSTDQNRASSLANDLKKLNDERKQMTEAGVADAIEIAKEFAEDKVLVIYLEDCHESIAGIIAGRVREKYNKPTFILTRTENCVKGSGRSIESYDMYSEMSKVKDLFIKFGGHKMAAGLSLDEKNVTLLRREINRLCPLTDLDLVPKIWIDMELPLQYITYNLVEELKRIEPFGKGNEKPCFAAKNIKIRKIMLLGDQGKVLKMELVAPTGHMFQGICFNKSQEFLSFIKEKYGSEEVKKLTRGIANDVDLKIIFYPNINTYNGRTTLQIVVQSFC